MLPRYSLPLSAHGIRISHCRVPGWCAEHIETLPQFFREGIGDVYQPM